MAELLLKQTSWQVLMSSNDDLWLGCKVGEVFVAKHISDAWPRSSSVLEGTCSKPCSSRMWLLSWIRPSNWKCISERSFPVQKWDHRFIVRRSFLPNFGAQPGRRRKHSVRFLGPLWMISVSESTVQKDRNALRSMTRGTAKILKAERQGRSKLPLFSDGKDGHQTFIVGCVYTP